MPQNTPQASMVIDLPKNYEVYDFSAGYDPNRALKFEFGVGKYNELRPDMYTNWIFEGIRNIHMGLDFGAPVGTPVRSFLPGEVHSFAFHKEPGNYGHTIITRHQINFEDQERDLYALYGHLSKKSLEGKFEGQALQQGEVFAWVGDRHENGAWNSHLHFQLSWIEPQGADMPGVVSSEQHEQALKDYPDPQVFLGKLY